MMPQVKKILPDTVAVTPSPPPPPTHTENQYEITLMSYVHLPKHLVLYMQIFSNFKVKYEL